MNPRIKLKKQYGALWVLKEERVHGVRFALTECRCGTRRTLPVYRLAYGMTTSCGARSCRSAYRVEEDPAVIVARQRTPRLGWDGLRKLYALYEKDELPVHEIAAQFGVSRATVHTYVRRVRAFGSVAAFEKACVTHHGALK